MITPTRDTAAGQRKCVLCGGIIMGYGHNAEPVKEGQCCAHWNTHIVLPKACSWRGIRDTAAGSDQST